MAVRAETEVDKVRDVILEVGNADEPDTRAGGVDFDRGNGQLIAFDLEDLRLPIDALDGYRHSSSLIARDLAHRVHEAHAVDARAVDFGDDISSQQTRLLGWVVLDDEHDPQRA